MSSAITLGNALNLTGINDVVTLQLGNTTAINKVSAPYTTIQNRALVTDFSTDNSIRMGIQRIPVQQISQVQGESGPT